MSFTEAVGQPGTGNIVLQHKGFRGNQYDLDYRAHKRVVRVTDRNADSGGVGGWQFDQDATGDLMLGMCWLQDKSQREIPMWSFGFPSVLSKGGGGGVATPGGAQAGAIFSGVATIAGPSAPPSGAPPSGPMQSLPIGDQTYKGDGRMLPITVPPRTLRAQGPQNPPAGGAGAGAGANPGGGDPSAGPQGQLGAGLNVVNPNSPQGGANVLILGINPGGHIGGISSFPTFGGVGNYFGGSPGAIFSGVPNIVGGGGSPGATFRDPTTPGPGGTIRIGRQ